MSGTDVQVPHREYFQGACIPDGYTQVKAPPKKWVKVIDGKKITPKVVQKVLLNCQAANVDLEYVAQCLGVGGYAITEYLRDEKTIPQTIAVKFVQLFSSNATLPKAPPAKPPIRWGTKVQRGATQIEKRIDFDAKRLAERFVEERKKRGEEWKHIAWAIKSTPLSIRRAEEGAIRNQFGQQSIIFRLCKYYEIDLRQYETKPRIDFKLFQKKIKAAKKKKDIGWEVVADLAGITERLLKDFRCNHRKSNVIYLSKEMEAVLEVLNIDKKEVYAK